MSKMNRNLITEIFRQKELMGIKQILSEGVGLNGIKVLFNLSDVDQSFVKVFDDAMEDIKTSNPGLIQDIKTNLNVSGDISFSSMKGGLRNITGFNQNSQILENLLQELTKSLKKVILSSKNPTYVELADQIIEESLKTMPVYKQAYDAMVNLAIAGKRAELDNYISRVRQFFDDDVIDYINNVKFKPTKFDVIYDQIKKKFGDAWVLTVKGWDKIKDFGSYLKKLTEKNSVLEGVFTSQPISFIAKKMHLDYDRYMTSPAELKKDMDEILNRIVDKLEKDFGTSINEEQNELLAKFNQFLSKRDESHKSIYVSWMNNWKQDPRLKRLFSEQLDTGNLDPQGKPIFIPEPFYFKTSFNDQKFIDMIEKLEQAKGTDILEIKQTYNKINGSISLMTNAIGLFRIWNGLDKKKWLRYFINMSDFVQRLSGTIVLYTPNTAKEVIHNYKMLGPRRWFGLGLGQKLVTSLVYIPVLLGVYKTVGSFIQDFVNEKNKLDAEEGKPLRKYMDWYLLDDDEWSKIMGGDDGQNDINKLVKLLANNIGDFSLTNVEELGTKALPWSIAAWAYISNPDLNITPSQFRQQNEAVKQESNTTLKGLFDLGNKDTQIQQTITNLKISDYDTLNQKIDSTLQQKPNLNDIEY